MEPIKGYDNYKTQNPFNNESDRRASTFDHIEPIDLKTIYPGCTHSDIKTILTAELETILFDLKIDCKGVNNFLNVHITGWYVDNTDEGIIDEINDIIIQKIQY